MTQRAHRTLDPRPAKRSPRAQVRRPDLAALTLRLTPRDIRLCERIWEYRVLTTQQCFELEFGTLNAAQQRLLVLAQLEVLIRFRPPVPLGAGSAPWHYVLGPAGAAVLAARRDTTVQALGYRRDEVTAIAQSQRLAHLVGVNGFFTALWHEARSRADAALTAWWSERRCRATWGQVVRPDGYGRWHDGPAEVDFFLEFDRGTEALDRLLAKLADYLLLVEATGIVTPVALWLPSRSREAQFHRLVQTLPPRPEVPVATACAGANPAGAVWLPADTDRRCRLVDLTPRPAR